VRRWCEKGKSQWTVFFFSQADGYFCNFQKDHGYFRNFRELRGYIWSFPS